MSLESLAPQVAALAAMRSAPLLGRGTPLPRMGRAALEVGDHLRVLAALSLLGRADEQQFCANLARSGDAWRHFLELAGTDGGDVPHFVSGRVRPVFDALAAGDLEAVRAIGRLAPPLLQNGKEYEDDFCTARFVFALVDDAPTDVLLERFAAFARDHFRLPVLAALSARDQHDYEKALDGLLDAFAIETSAMLDRGAEDTLRFRVERAISIEAVAWQRLAVLRGLSAAPEGVGCPSLALEPYAGAWPREFSGG